MKSQLFLCLLLVSSMAALAQESAPVAKGKPDQPVATAAQPLATGQRIFLCGHSFHFHVPAMLEEIAKLAGLQEQKIVGKSMIGGSQAIQHWNVKDENNQAKQALKAGEVDVLTLTPIYLPDDGMEKFAVFGLEHNPKLRITVQEFWLPYDAYEPRYYNAPRIPAPKTVDHNAATVDRLREIHQRYFEEMDQQIQKVNKQAGKQVLFVVPVGQAVIALREKIIAGQAPGLKSQEDLFTDPLGHARPPLQVLATYCHFAVIYRKNPLGLPVPQALKQMKLPGDEAESLNRLLQELAWDAAVHHSLSGIAAPLK